MAHVILNIFNGNEMKTRRLYTLMAIALLFFRCSKSDEYIGNGLELGITEDITICIDQHLANGKTLNLLTTTTKETIRSIQMVLPVGHLIIRIVDNPALIIPEIGIGGFNPNQNEVVIAFDSDFFGQRKDTINYKMILCHEIHHAVRRRSVGYGSTLLEAIISEGLADHFSMEITGVVAPPWSVALHKDDLKQLTEIAQPLWTNSNYNHDKWFFGTDPTIPRWSGYAIGFAMVDNYLKKYPSVTAGQLHNEPAETFILE